jgi:hypothetical protein
LPGPDIGDHSILRRDNEGSSPRLVLRGQQ